MWSVTATKRHLLDTGLDDARANHDAIRQKSAETPLPQEPIFTALTFMAKCARKAPGYMTRQSVQCHKGRHKMPEESFSCDCI